MHEYIIYYKYCLNTITKMNVKMNPTENRRKSEKLLYEAEDNVGNCVYCLCPCRGRSPIRCIQCNNEMYIDFLHLGFNGSDAKTTDKINVHSVQKKTYSRKICMSVLQNMFNSCKVNFISRRNYFILVSFPEYTSIPRP